MDKQQTVATSQAVSGIALHTGARATVRLLPGAENTGVVFRRVDLPGKPEIHALASNVVDVQRGTTIAEGNGMVATVEHIMSALHACRVDNCIVEMNGAEPPICDGSSLPYYEMIRSAGIVRQDAEAKYFTPAQPIYVEGKVTRLVFLPGPEPLRISCLTSFRGCPVDPQFEEYVLDPETYGAQIAPGRTFVDYSELKVLLSMGLCKGGSLDAAAIIHNGAIICKDQLRFPNEIVRHKILDVIGDLYLTGRRLTGKVIAIKPGHPNNVEMAKRLMAQMQ